MYLLYKHLLPKHLFWTNLDTVAIVATVADILVIYKRLIRV